MISADEPSDSDEMDSPSNRPTLSLDYLMRWLRSSDDGASHTSSQHPLDIQAAKVENSLMNQGSLLKNADRPILEWSPHHMDRRFVVSTPSELRLYSMKEITTGVTGPQRQYMWDQIYQQTTDTPINALDWCPEFIDNLDVLATGGLNGRIDIRTLPVPLGSKFSKDSSYGYNDVLAGIQQQKPADPPSLTHPVINLNDKSDSISVTICPASNRACHALSFNPHASHYLAAGFEYTEGKQGIHIFNISRLVQQWDSVANSISSDNSNSRTMELSQIYSQNANYGCMSLTWVPNHSDHLIVGSLGRGNKNNNASNACNRMIDLRIHSSSLLFWNSTLEDRPNDPLAKAQTIYDLQFDPFNPTQFMANDRLSVLRFWDTRQLNEPLFTLDTQIPRTQGLVKVCYSRRRRGVVSILAKNSTSVKFWDLRCATDGETPREDSNFPDMTRYNNDHLGSIDSFNNSKKSMWAEKGSYINFGDIPLSTFAWVPGTSTNGIAPSCRMVACSTQGLLFPLEKMNKRVATIGPHGSLVIANNWEGLFDEVPSSEERRTILHKHFAEVNIITPLTRYDTQIPKSAAHTNPHGSISYSPHNLNSGNHVQTVIPSHLMGNSLPISSSISNIAQQRSIDDKISKSQMLARRQKAILKNQNHEGVDDLTRNIPRLNVDIGRVSFAPSAAMRNVDHYYPSGHEHTRISFRPDTINGQDRSESFDRHILGEDISVRMYRLAQLGYGMNADKNTKIFSDDQALRSAWTWVRDCEFAQKCGRYKIGKVGHISFYGVYRIMTMDTSILFKLEKYSSNYGISPKGSKVSLPNSGNNSYISLGKYERRSGDSMANEQTNDAENRDELEVNLNEPEIMGGSKLNRRRHISLQMCGWDLEGVVLESHIKVLEDCDKIEMAAFVSFIYGNHARAVESLKKSKNAELQLLGLMITNQLDQTTGRIFEQLQSTSSASFPETGVFKNPHILAIIVYLASRNWMEILEHVEKLSMSEKLGIALRYLPDDVLMGYLRKLCIRVIKNGEIDGLLLTGIQKYGHILLTNYVDNTTDIQTAALVTTFDPLPYSNKSVDRFSAAVIVERWAYAYRVTMNAWRMFNERCLFEIACGDKRIAKGFPRLNHFQSTLMTRPTDVRCNTCNNFIGYFPKSGFTSSDNLNLLNAAPMVAPNILSKENGVRKTNPKGILTKMFPKSFSNPTPGGANQNIQSRMLHIYCPNCRKLLPRCSVCRLTLGTPPPKEDKDRGIYRNDRTDDSKFEQSFSWCQTCGHGGHAGHMNEWFEAHSECPVPHCRCHCSELY
ncbi:hypothetical protein H4219_000628 [Mycoemilia scoparia]|uniref:GATOR2 complex protein MIO zinc-ribbon like domain-containing protein n=1 Tax=Mycoemilia scoparia TaxID=417184 RepID=A0A9W8DRF1_9FUNG|nr:hypothetical protein H4219_000628 [Mycoemilia scoparia]